LQNSEDLLTHYAVGRFADYGKKSSVVITS